MELGGGRPRRGRLVTAAGAFVLLWWISFCVFFSVCALLTEGEGRATAHLATGDSCGRGQDSHVQKVALATKRGNGVAAAAEEGPWRRRAMTAIRRNLVGPGSYPPRCTSKCGGCTPCKPVHVPVPPGTPVITEYYPEAWRCKCGGRLYMP